MDISPLSNSTSNEKLLRVVALGMTRLVKLVTWLGTKQSEARPTTMDAALSADGMSVAHDC